MSPLRRLVSCLLSSWSPVFDSACCRLLELCEWELLEGVSDRDRDRSGGFSWERPNLNRR